MENFQTSNNPLHIEPNKSVIDHYGLISELKREKSQSCKPRYYLVMGTLILKDYKGNPKPMTFDYETGTFCWSYPDMEEWGEVYDKETAMKLIAHHVLNTSDSIKFDLAPVHIPFLISNDGEYQNPYLMTGASTESVKKMSLDYMESDGYVDEKFYMPKSLGGEFIGYGSQPVEEDEEEEQDEVNDEPQQPKLVDVSDLPFIKPEEVAEFPDLLRSDWEMTNWSRSMNKYSLPHLPESLTVSPKHYMICGVRQEVAARQQPSPLTRVVDGLLGHADTAGEPDEQLPSPLLFNLDTAKSLISERLDWEQEKDIDPNDRFDMYVVPVFPDNGNVQIAQIKQDPVSIAGE